MSGIPIAVPSDSHKATVKWEMKIDKLTMLYDLPEQWKEGMTSAMIDLVTDPSNQFLHGVSRSFSRGCRGYEVSIEGRAPLSKSPLVWSPKAAYLLQVGPKKGKKPWLRLDINPEGLTASGMAHLGEKLQDIFGVPWPTWRFARVSRIDVAIDLHGVALTDWVFDLPKRRAREVICRQREVRTVYLGAKRASPLVVYNKAKQNPEMAADNAVTRVEYRAKYTGPVSALLKLANPLRDVVVFDPTRLPYPDPHRTALKATGHLHGWYGIMHSFPQSQRTIIEHGLTKAKAVWRKPLEIWEVWAKCLKTTLPTIFEAQDDKCGSAAAYFLAMKLQTEPTTGHVAPDSHSKIGLLAYLPVMSGF